MPDSAGTPRARCLRLHDGHYICLLPKGHEGKHGQFEVPGGWKPVMVAALKDADEQQDWTGLHPWYGPCDGFADGACAECEYTIRCFAEVAARALFRAEPERAARSTQGDNADG